MACFDRRHPGHVGPWETRVDPVCTELATAILAQVPAGAIAWLNDLLPLADPPAP